MLNIQSIEEMEIQFSLNKTEDKIQKEFCVKPFEGIDIFRGFYPKNYRKLFIRRNQ